jgi:hypothetical protein
MRTRSAARIELYRRQSHIDGMPHDHDEDVFNRITQYLIVQLPCYFHQAFNAFPYYFVSG